MLWLRYANMLLKKDPDDKRVQVNLSSIHCQKGSALFGNGKMEEALAEFKSAVAYDSNSAIAIGNIGIVYGKMGDTALEKAFYRRALTKDPNNEMFSKNLLSLNGEADDFISALHKDSMLLINDPANKKILMDMSNLHVNIGVKYVNGTQYNKAFKEFSLAEKIDSSSANTIGNIGVVYFYKGNYKKARDCFQKTLARDPKNEIFIKDLQQANSNIGK